MSFSPSLDSWLSTFASFVHEPFDEDLLGGRALGPASGVLGDAYPFLHGCPYSGLFAGLSLSGIRSSDTDVRLLEYSASYGFVPGQGSPFSGEKWQEFSGDRWQQIDPRLYTPCRVSPPTHPADVILSIGEKRVSTRTWSYKTMPLSNKYDQHSWMGEGYCLVIVTFRDRPEHAAPFLRPCFIAGQSARIDPHCLYTETPSPRFFDGRVVLMPGSQMGFSVQETTITLKKENTEGTGLVLQQISGVSPNTAGNISCISSGCCRFTYPCIECDPVTKAAALDAGLVSVQNACKACCNCDDYIQYYDKLRGLAALQRKLIVEFTELYAESVTLRNQLAARLRRKLKLIQVQLGEWGEDREGFYCDFFVIVSATDTLKPPSSVWLFFTQNGNPLPIRKVKMMSRPSGVTMTAAVMQGGSLQLNDIRANFKGAKALRLRVRFHTAFSASTFTSSGMEIKAHGSV